jgi:hypothetical protein
MDKPPPTRRKMHTYTVGALLALFVVAVVAALASRLLPGGLSGIVARKFRGSGEASGSGDASGSGEGGSEKS